MALDCIIPAAGASSRMGAFKPLLPFAASTVVETVVGAALDAGLRVILVLGFRAGDVAPRFSSLSNEGRVVLVDNPRWEEGMMSSLQAGLPLVSGDHFSTIPADMPLVGGAIHKALEAAWLERLASGLPPLPLFASFKGEAGHPVLIPSSLIPGLLGLGGGERARPFLMARGGLLLDMASVADGSAGGSAGGAAVLADLDTYDDYRAARSAHGMD